MSDSSEDEDLSKFKESVDPTFAKLINESRGEIPKESDFVETKKSDRYLETSTHYNDIRFPEEMQKKVGAKISEIIGRHVEFVTLNNKIKKHKIKGGIKLFSDSKDFLSCNEAEDTFTRDHNKNSLKLKNQKKAHCDINVCDEDRIKSAAVSGEYIMSKQATKFWKSRRKEKIFRYKYDSGSNVLTAV